MFSDGDHGSSGKDVAMLAFIHFGQIREQNFKKLEDAVYNQSKIYPRISPLLESDDRSGG